MVNETGDSPWRLIWFSPTQAMAVIARRPGPVLALAAVSGGLGLLVQLATAAPQDMMIRGPDLIFILLISAFLASVSIIGLYIGGWITNALARGFGGDGSSSLTRAALAWSHAITIPLSVFVLSCIAYFKIAPNATLSLMLVLASALTSIWSFILFVRMLGYAQNLSPARSFIVALLQIAVLYGAAIGFRIFVAQSFVAASNSMAPTFLPGDYFFVSKGSYGYSRYSLPFSLQLFDGRVLSTPPARGDIVVFRHPTQRGVDYIARVIGLPGDQIQLRQGRLYINDRIIVRRKITPVRILGPNGKTQEATTYEETLPGGHTHVIVEALGDRGFLDDTKIFSVPADRYFMLGDNRDNSIDSRVEQESNGVGLVPAENIIGRAAIVYFSLGQDDPAEPPQLRLDRFGALLH